MLALKIVIALVLFGLVGGWLFLQDIDIAGPWGIVCFIAFMLFCILYIVGDTIRRHRGE